MKLQIYVILRTILVFIIQLCFTIAFFKTDSGTMWAVGLIFFCLTFKTFMFFIDSLISIYIDIKFLGKTF